jgi:hypothetical protein
MASTYVNNLRLEEMATGEQSGTWGTKTNTNLELIGQATAWGTRAIANASTDNITIADGAADADRCLGLKLTGGGQACTVTLLPNTSSKTWVMYNATSYTLTFTCGSGANVAILAGETKMIATDGLGSGGVVHDLLTSVNLAGTTKTAALTNAGVLTQGGILSVDDTTTSTSGTTGSIHTDGGLGVAGTAFVAGAATVGGASQFNSTVTVGVNDTGYDVKFFGATSGAHMLWDESADDLKLVGAAGLTVAGDIDVDGTTNLDAVDIDGAVQIDATLSVGVDDTGYDVKFFGATASRYLLWDESADSLLFSDNAKAVFGQPGNDLQIVHDSNNSFITDAGTGNLYLDSNAGNIYLRVNASENALEAVGNGAVTLYYDGSAKIATSADGVTVTGGTTSVGTGGVTIDATAAADANPELELTAVARQFNIGVGGATFATTALRGSYYIYDTTATAYRFSINSSGNVGIGTNSQTDNLQVTGSGRRAIGVSSTGTGAAVLELLSSGSTEAISYGTELRFAKITGLGDAGFSETMRIKVGGAGGTLFVGGTTVRNAGQVNIDYTSASQGGMGINDTNSGNGGSHIAFLTGGTVRGAITNNNNSAVAYNTTSDARLKENLVSISDAIGRVNNLNPVKFNWIESGSVSEGFIAQEILAGDEQLAADMVTGDPDGDAETAPLQVDYAKITPLLTAALQQALAKIDVLEARISKLEGN